jgi:hypothetical protein
MRCQSGQRLSFFALFLLLSVCSPSSCAVHCCRAGKYISYGQLEAQLKLIAKQTGKKFECALSCLSLPALRDTTLMCAYVCFADRTEVVELNAVAAVGDQLEGICNCNLFFPPCCLSHSPFSLVLSAARANMHRVASLPLARVRGESKLNVNAGVGGVEMGDGGNGYEKVDFGSLLEDTTLPEDDPERAFFRIIVRRTHRSPPPHLRCSLDLHFGPPHSKPIS